MWRLRNEQPLSREDCHDQAEIYRKKDLGGVIRKSPGASMRIWVTADELRLPVRVRSKVVVGYFTADLVAVE